MRRNKWGNQKGTSSLNEMAMLALSNPMLSISARTWKLRKSTLRGQKLAKSIRYVLATRIRTKHFNRSGKLSMHHTSKILVNGTQLGAMFHKVNPSISRVIINKNNIILMTTLGGKRCFTPYIRMNKIKRSSWMRCTRRIWKLNLFSKFTALTLEARLDKSIA